MHLVHAAACLIENNISKLSEVMAAEALLLRFNLRSHSNSDVPILIPSKDQILKAGDLVELTQTKNMFVN
jgi:hypothetical protein